MKIYADRLGEELAKGLQRLYTLTGDDPLLMQEAGDEIRAAARTAGFAERQLFHVDGGFDWAQLSQAVNSPSLFAGRRLIEVRMTAKPDKTAALLEAAERLDDDSLMLLVMPRVDAATQRSKWFTRLASLGLFIQVWPIDAAKLPGWLQGRCRQRGVKAGTLAIRMMAQRLEGNLLAAVQEIERLKLLAGDQEVTEEMVAASVADSARYDVYKLIDAALAGHQPRVARMVQGLQAEGTEVLYLANALAREIRALERMAVQLAGGQRMPAVLSQGRVWKNRMKPVQRCLERTTPAQLRRCQQAVGQVDRMVKGVEAGDPWRQMMGLLLTLAGAKMGAIGV